MKITIPLFLLQNIAHKIFVLTNYLKKGKISSYLVCLQKSKIYIYIYSVVKAKFSVLGVFSVHSM